MKKLAIAVCLLFSATLSFAQQQPKPSPEPTTDVIRVDTNLVQTTVTVLDKQGKFVEGLRQEDFQLNVDGKPQAISFFSRITAGTEREKSQLGALKSGTTAPLTTSDTEVLGRTIIFFIDDLHLSATSVNKTRETITNFLSNQMGPNDVVAIASATGQIGFLQQFTDNKSVLRAAIGRLNHRPYVIQDTEAVKMTEYAALRIDQGDKDALSYYANEYLKATKFNSPGGGVGPPQGGAVASSAGAGRTQQSSGISREIAERQVKERASMMLRQASAVTTNTIAGLESLLHTAAQQDGRKLVFFVSDGFYLNDRNTGFVNKLREVIDSAIRAGVVIYSLDARGLVSSTDATSNRFDPEGKLARSNVGELSASQDGMNALAGDTGGRALFNSEQLTNAIDRALKETSDYYLLAWRPATEAQKSTSFKKIEVTVSGRTDLSVRLPKGYLVKPGANTNATAAAEPGTIKPSNEKPADADLKRALSAALSQANIPTTVAATFIDAPDVGAIVTTSVQTSALALDYGSDGKAAVDVAGVILNDQGKVAESFRTRLAVNALPAQYTAQDTGVIYNFKTKIKPGLYQVRAAVRDEKSGKVGSASQWIEIPDLSGRRLTVSSVLLRSTNKGDKSVATGDPKYSVDRHFSKSSQLNFLLFIYNAAHDSTPNSTPDVTAQVEIFRKGVSVISTPVRKLSMEGMTDLARIPYGGQFPLESLPGGRYELQITITDRLAKTSASQRLPFRIE